MSIPNREPDIKRKFLCNDIKANNNKWWQIEFWISEGVWRVTFARVGQQCGKPDIKTGVTLGMVEKKIAEKTGRAKGDSRYVEVELLSKPTVSVNRLSDAKMQSRIDAIMRAANEDIASYLAVRVDELSAAQIERGRNLLEELHRKPSVEILDKYYNTIPTRLDVNFVRKNNPLDILKWFVEQFDEESQRLDQLSAAVASNQGIVESKDVFDILGAGLEPVEIDFPIKYKECYKVDLRNVPYDVSCDKLLFHGTSSSYVRHILRQGLICPKYHSNGRAFGDGIYFGDDYRKSLNYTNSYDGDKYMFVVAVCLGKTYEAQSTGRPPAGYDSLYAPARKNIGGIWNGFLNYSEYVVYKRENQKIRYLVVL